MGQDKFWLAYVMTFCAFILPWNEEVLFPPCGIDECAMQAFFILILYCDLYWLNNLDAKIQLSLSTRYFFFRYEGCKGGLFSYERLCHWQSWYTTFLGTSGCLYSYILAIPPVYVTWDSYLLMFLSADSLQSSLFSCDCFHIRCFELNFCQFFSTIPRCFL